MASCSKCRKLKPADVGIVPGPFLGQVAWLCSEWGIYMSPTDLCHKFIPGEWFALNEETNGPTKAD